MKHEIILYDTMTRRKESFQPLDSNCVRLYACGPTVYDHAHIGNARPAIVFDLLYRLLRHAYGREHVKYVRNLTDVDDKINARALEERAKSTKSGKMSVEKTIRLIASRAEEQYHRDVAALGCLSPDVEPRATEHIPDMIETIQLLLDRGHAYAAKGKAGWEILFDCASMPDYGKLSRRNLEEQEAGSRVAVEPHKRNPRDFVTWKESSSSEPGWDAEFRFEGEAIRIHGRPGWHIECSAMSKTHLGETFDIHAGGLDLIFPHHENEIAQSRCAFDVPFMARRWMHNGFLQVEGQKMSKSLGNFLTIRQTLRGKIPGWEKGHVNGIALRIAMLLTHYREPIDWTKKRMEEGQRVLEKLYAPIRSDFPENYRKAKRRVRKEIKSEEGQRFLVHLCNDLNSVEAIRALEALAERASDDGCKAELLRLLMDFGFLTPRSMRPGRKMGVSLERKNCADIIALGMLFSIADSNFDAKLKREIREKIKKADYELGIRKLFSKEEIGAMERQIGIKIRSRLAFLRKGALDKADGIRDELAAIGIELRDRKDPETGERKTDWVQKIQPQEKGDD